MYLGKKRLPDVLLAYLQEYVGGTTYFYAAATPQQPENAVSTSPLVVEEDSVPAILVPPSQSSSISMFPGSVTHGKNLSQISESLMINVFVFFYIYIYSFIGVQARCRPLNIVSFDEIADTPTVNSSSSNSSSSLVSGTSAAAAVADSSYFISNQLRQEIQHKNNLTLLQPDHNLYPG